MWPNLWPLTTQKWSLVIVVPTQIRHPGLHTCPHLHAGQCAFAPLLPARWGQSWGCDLKVCPSRAREPNAKWAYHPPCRLVIFPDILTKIHPPSTYEQGHKQTRQYGSPTQADPDSKKAFLRAAMFGNAVVTTSFQWLMPSHLVFVFWASINLVGDNLLRWSNRFWNNWPLDITSVVDLGYGVDGTRNHLWPNENR